MEIQKFSINNMRFDKKDYQYAKKKIIEKYEEEFPHYKISISYKKINKQYIYKVSNIMDLLNCSGIVTKKIPICKYTNSEVIEIFIKDKKEELYQKYYYDQINYLNKLKEYIDSVVTLYKLQNIDIMVEFNKDCFIIHRPYIIKMNTYISCKKFKFQYSDCVTKNEFENLKIEINNFIDEFDKKQK